MFVEREATVPRFVVVMIVAGELDRAEERLDAAGAIAINSFAFVAWLEFGNEVAIIEQVFDHALGIAMKSLAQGCFQPLTQMVDALSLDAFRDLR